MNKEKIYKTIVKHFIMMVKEYNCYYQLKKLLRRVVNADDELSFGSCNSFGKAWHLNWLCEDLNKRMGDVYLNEPIGKDKDDNEITLQEILENDSKNIEDEVDLKIKTKLLNEKMKVVLKKREKEILELRFGLNGKNSKTQSEIAKMYNISRSYVSRIETKAINKLSKIIFES